MKGSFNINYSVYIKLTPFGIESLKRKSREFALSVNMPELASPIIEDVGEGWSKWQLWDLMNQLGEFCQMGMKAPFETTILFEKPQLESDDEK